MPERGRQLLRTLLIIVRFRENVMLVSLAGHGVMIDPPSKLGMPLGAWIYSGIVLMIRMVSSEQSIMKQIFADHIKG